MLEPKAITEAESAILETLQLDLRRLWIWGCLLLFFGAGVLALAWDFRAAIQWLWLSMVICWLVYKQAARLLPLNRPSGANALYPSLGWANQLTLLRGILIAMTGGFLFQVWPPGLLAWAPGVIYTLAAVIDRVDGYVARKTGLPSQMGSELDIKFDALGLVVAPLLACLYGQVHWSYLSVSLAYYLFQWGTAYRIRKGLPVFELPQNLNRRSMAGFQMGFIAVALWPLLSPYYTSLAGVAFMLPLLLGFSIDWLTVSGRITWGSGGIDKILLKGRNLLEVIILPLLRGLVFLLICYLLPSLSNQSGFSWPTAVFIAAVVIAAMSVLLGLAGRVAALVLVSLLGIHYLEIPLDTSGTLLLLSLVWVMSLGTGAYNLWTWDENWVNRYDGA